MSRTIIHIAKDWFIEWNDQFINIIKFSFYIINIMSTSTCLIKT